jgi:hypothetical protein
MSTTTPSSGECRKSSDESGLVLRSRAEKRSRGTIPDRVHSILDDASKKKSITEIFTDSSLEDDQDFKDEFIKCIKRPHWCLDVIESLISREDAVPPRRATEKIIIQKEPSFDFSPYWAVGFCLLFVVMNLQWVIVLTFVHYFKA